MADDAKLGTTWKDDELNVIVADYFSMLMAELSGKTYTKSRHSAALMASIGRTHRSVEFKHQNISAVLEEMGMPWIRGYKPKRNYQNAIFDAIDRYLTKHPNALVPAQAMPQQPSSPGDVFVSPPVPPPDREKLPPKLRQLVRKFDPVERDRRNRSLGKAGESFVFELENADCSNQTARTWRAEFGGFRPKRETGRVMTSSRLTPPARAVSSRSRRRMGPHARPSF